MSFVLDDLHAALRRYVVFPTPEAAVASALWIAATHAQEAWEHAPRLAIVAPEKKCGKSRLMDIAEATSNKSTATVNISPAALVRFITADNPPTLFLDEADAIFGPKAGDDHENLRGIINAGHQRNRPYIRYDVATRGPEYCPTFCMVALAGIGDLPDTIMDRSVVVRMRRRGPGERVAPFRTRRDGPALTRIRDQLHEWLLPHLDQLQGAEPVMPLEDRAADTWEPLIAVADLAGTEWAAKARLAADMLVKGETAADAEGSLGVQLLGDIRTIFGNSAVQAFMRSSDLAIALRRMDDSPWQDMDLTTARLATSLRPYDIRPARDVTGNKRGYNPAWFADAWARYLPVKERQDVKDPS